MWTRAALKEKAKNALNANYWRVILVTLIVFVIGGASSGSGVTFDTSSFTTAFENGFMAGLSGEADFDEDFYFEDEDDSFDEDYYWDDDYIFEEDFSFEDDFYDSTDEDLRMASLFGVGVVVILLCVVVVVIMAIALIIGFIFSVLICCPLEVGTKRFFFKSLSQKAEVKEVAYAFDNNYKNVIKTLFFRDLYTIGWSLLFVIPGIIKGYEYLMIPYLLAENPNLSKEEAFALSKQMMMGHKWDAFVLNLSFIGWDFLSGLTMGILGIFYVQPYKCLTFAALYEELSLINGRPATAKQNIGDFFQYQQTNPYVENTQPEYEAVKEEI